MSDMIRFLNIETYTYFVCLPFSNLQNTIFCKMEVTKIFKNLFIRYVTNKDDISYPFIIKTNLNRSSSTVIL